MSHTREARRSWRCWGASAGAILLAGLGAGGCAQSAASQDPAVLRFATPISLTGQFASDGRLTLDGYQYCARVVNAEGGVRVGARRLRLQIVASDDQSSPLISASLVQGFDQQGIHFILGPYGSTDTAADAPVAERNQQILADSAGADDTIFGNGYRWVFGVEAPASQYAATIVEAIINEARPRPRTVAFVAANDGFSQEVVRSGIIEAERLGLRVFPPITFPAGSTNLDSVVTTLRDERPDAVVESGHLVEGLAFVQDAAQLGLRPDGVGETVAPPDPQFTQVLGPLADGVLGSTQWVPDQPATGPIFGSAASYAAGFRTVYGFVPDYHPAEATAACLALVLAIEQAGSTNPERVRAKLATLDTQTFFGLLRFDPEGEDIYQHMDVMQVQDGQAVTVWPQQLATGRMIWPAPPGGAGQGQRPGSA